MPSPFPGMDPYLEGSLDLQRALTNIYDMLGYDLAIDYSQPPELPLSAQQAAWAKDRFRSAGGPQ